MTTPRTIDLDALNPDQLEALLELPQLPAEIRTKAEARARWLGLSIVVVPPHPSHTKAGKLTDVEGYTYEREGGRMDLGEPHALVTAPSATVKPLPFPVKISPLIDEDEPVVTDTLSRLSEKYPTASARITKVITGPLKTRWGQFSPSTGVLKLTSMSSKFPEYPPKGYRDPKLADTVSHEFGHALLQDLAGTLTPSEMPQVPKGLAKHGQDWNTAVRAYNDAVEYQESKVNGLVRQLQGQIKEHFGGDSQKVAAAITSEFSKRSPFYVLMNPEELIVEAFAHYETGQHGTIADIIGSQIEEMYKAR